MTVNYRYSFILGMLFWLLSFGLFGQIESLSDAPIPCDKVFAVQGNTGIGARSLGFYFNDVVHFDLSTGAVISSFDKRVLKDFAHGGIHYFLLSDDSHWSPGRLYLFEDGELHPADFVQDLNDIYFLQQLDGIIGETDDGIVLLSNGELIDEVELGVEPIDLKAYGNGFIAVADTAYYFLDSGLDVSEEHSIPSGYRSFDGAMSGDVLLLSESNVDSLRHLSLYNIATQELYPVVDGQGSPATVLSFVSPKGTHEGDFFLAGTGLITPAPFTQTFPTDAGFINISSGEYTPANTRLGMRQAIVQPVLVESANGPVVFGRMGIEGIEPYTLNEQSIEVLKDIYTGFGSSFAFDRQFTDHLFLYSAYDMEVVADGGVLYFAARSAALGQQVWRTDGTEDGTFAVTGERIAEKGFSKCFLNKDTENILITIQYRDRVSRLYKLGQNPAPVVSDLNEALNWEVAYASSPLVQGGSSFFENNHPGVHLARDGTSMLVLQRTDLYVDHLAFNQYWVLPTFKLQGGYARTAMQITNADGSLKSSALIRARRDEERTVGRAFETGRVYAVISHRPADTYVNGEVLGESRNGHYLIEFNSEGRLEKATFLPTGGKGKISFSEVKLSDEGIYLLGMANDGFDLDGAYVNVIAAQQERAVILKYNLDHTLRWINDTDLDQDIFGDGLQSLVVGEASVFIASGGTSYNVSSSCAYSEWPYQISRFDKQTGNREWRTILEANDVTRITSMEAVGEQWLWVGGYSRGDLKIGDRSLENVPNYLSCSYNSYLLCLNIESGISSFLGHSDPSRAKFIQDIRYRDNHLYTLAMVYEEDLFPAPLQGYDGRWNLQLDKYTNGGLKVDSLLWPTSLSRFRLEDRLRENKFSFDLYPEGGVLIAGVHVSNGDIDGFASPSSEAARSYLSSWLLQRREIEALESASLPETQTSGGGAFQIYPNPLTGSAFVLTVHPDDVEKYDQLALIDVQGRRCLSQNLSGPFESRLIDLDSFLANGIYIVQLVGPGGSVSKKLVLNR